MNLEKVEFIINGYDTLIVDAKDIARFHIEDVKENLTFNSDTGKLDKYYTFGKAWFKFADVDLSALRGHLNYDVEDKVNVHHFLSENHPILFVLHTDNGVITCEVPWEGQVRGLWNNESHINRGQVLRETDEGLVLEFR